MAITRCLTLSVALLAALSFGGCDTPDREGGDGWAGTVDTLASGRVVVRSPDVPVSDTPWTLRERFRLGALEGDRPDLFGQIAGLELGPAGEVYVLDGQASEIRVFGNDGTFVRRFGRRGEGPGELSNPGGLALDADGTLWLLNWGNGRYSGFDPATGEVEREARRLVSYATFPWPGAFENGTRLLDVGLDRTGEPALLRLDTAFVPTDTLPLPAPDEADRIVFRRGEMMVASLTEPFAPRAVWAPRPRGGIVLGEGAEYRLHRIAFDGDTAITFVLERERASVTGAEADSALAFFDEMAGSLDGATPDRRPRARDEKPAHGALFVDAEDRTWVRSVGPAGAAPAWDVFGPDGRFLAAVEIPDPPGFLPPVVRGGRLALVTQVNGFPEVVVYDLVEGGG